MRLVFILGTLLMIILLTNCGSSDSDLVNVTQGFLDSLTEKQLGDLNYIISVPADYSITENQGEDFSVFYFSPVDTTIKNKFSGGIYFGNDPDKFDIPSDTCKKEMIKGRMLEENVGWVVYNCTENYSIQTITAIKGQEEWYNQIHVFGHSKGRPELYKMLKVYSTLKER